MENRPIEKFDWGHSLVESYLDLNGNFSEITDLVSAVSSICFDEKDRVVLMNGDLIGGHIEPSESPEEALKRESLEEGGIELQKWKYFGYYKILQKDDAQQKFKTKYPKLSYILFYLSTGKKIIEPYGQEVEKVEYLSVKEAVKLKRNHKMFLEGVKLYPKYLD